MAKRQSRARSGLTPRARDVLRLVVNAVAFGTHDDDGELGAIAQALGTTPGRLQPILRKLKEQGYIMLKGTFVYPTAAALLWQNPALSKREAQTILSRLR